MPGGMLVDSAVLVVATLVHGRQIVIHCSIEVTKPSIKGAPGNQRSRYTMHVSNCYASPESNNFLP